MEQTPYQPAPLPTFGTDDFANNPDPRCPCLLLLDKSGSMAGARIQQLNDGIQAFKTELGEDSLASKRVEVAIVSFGPLTIDCEFQTGYSFSPPMLAASGDTPMGAAIERGLDLLASRKQEYRSHGVLFYRPWVFLLTDGAPTDSWTRAAQLIADGEQRNSFSFFAIGVEGADFNVLKQLSPARPPLALQGLRFKEFFVWLSNSMSRVSASQVGDKVQLAAPAGWGEVST